MPATLGSLICSDGPTPPQPFNGIGSWACSLGTAPMPFGALRSLGLPSDHSSKRRRPVNKYHLNNPCPKCEATGAKVKYHLPDRAKCALPDREEHMQRTCQICGGEWAEVPLAAYPPLRTH